PTHSAGAARTTATKAVGRSAIAIGRVATMLRTMLPVTVVVPDLPVVDVVSVEIVVVVDVDVAAIPIAVAPPVVRDTRTDQNARSQREPHAGIVSGIGVGIIRVGRRTIDNGR